MRKYLVYWIGCMAVWVLASCSTTKYVPEGAYLLDAVKIQTDSKEVSSSDLQPYLRQLPNGKWFSLVKTQLHLYSLSGRDSAKWVNRTLRKIGSAPVIYDEKLAARSHEEITRAVHNMGYMRATVNQTVQVKKKKLKLFYEVSVGKPYTIKRLNYDVSDSIVAGYLAKDSLQTLLAEEMIFDVNVLDGERQRITELLGRNGYYKFNKDFVSYTADTIQDTYQINLTLHVHPYRISVNDTPKDHLRYKINKVSFITDFDVMKSSMMNSMEISDSVHYAGYPIYYKDKQYLRPKVLVDNLYIRPGTYYNERSVQRTYASLGRLPALKYTNIRFVETMLGDSVALDAYVMLTKAKNQSVSFEVEGTNSSGDLGAAAAISYQHRNLFQGSERFMVKFRGAYEAISGLGSDYTYDNYMEYGVETSLNFPSFMFPFLSSDFKRGIRASTEFGLQYNYQLRPEFSRMVVSGSWGYRWQRRRHFHRIDLIDLNYLYMPWISTKFQEDYLEGDNKNYILEYNYKDRLIMRTGYMYNYNSIGSNLTSNTIASNSYSIRAGIEFAGNLLYAFSTTFNRPQNDLGEYKIWGIPFAQYVKVDFDFAKNIVITPGNSIAYHIGLGIATPYANSDLIPFEKRYFSGGANSVRGWSVRGVGPGTFSSKDSNVLNQSGDIKFDASIEYRSELFWKFQGAFFVDAGNVWTIRDYNDQSGGKFYFDKFYKQIAMSYGMGLRLDLDFFVLRFDGGMKAINPVYESGKDRYPAIRPKFSRDFAFHFAVGYPF